MAEEATESGEAAVSQREAIESLKSMFSTLVPPEDLEIRDAFGNVYMTRSAIPARAQIKVMQQLDRIWESESDGIDLGNLGGVSGISKLLIQLATDPVIFESICGAFACAHPEAVKASKESAISQGVKKSSASHPGDLFPLEEIVAGLIPFFIRLASRTVTLINRMTSQPIPQENQ